MINKNTEDGTYVYKKDKSCVCMSYETNFNLKKTQLYGFTNLHHQNLFSFNVTEIYASVEPSQLTFARSNSDPTSSLQLEILIIACTSERVILCEHRSDTAC